MGPGQKGVPLLLRTRDDGGRRHRLLPVPSLTKPYQALACSTNLSPYLKPPFLFYGVVSVIRWVIP